MFSDPGFPGLLERIVQIGYIKFCVNYINSDIIPYMKQLKFKGSSLDRLREFPTDARQQAGYQLDKIQRGEDPSDWKPMKTVGLGVKEIRIRTEDGAYRVIYVAKFSDTIYVLNAFQKKQQKTPKDEINIAKRNFGGIND